MAVAHNVHIFVGKTKVEFDTDQVTGRQIKEKAGVPLENDLAIKRGGELVLVTNDELITIKNGEHFVDLPAGTIS
jgi:hypothetical protein